MDPTPTHYHHHIRQRHRLLLLTLFVLTTLAFPVTAQEDDVIRVDSAVVILNATVTDRTGRPVLGLRRNQFGVIEDGKPQKIEVFETETSPFAAVVLLDSSGSMEERINLARSAAISFLDGLRVDDVAAVYNFDTTISLVQDFSNSRDIVERIFDLKSVGMTVLNDAIVKAAGELMKRGERRKAIVVLSDGADTKSGASADKALRAALEANATIYTVDMSSPDSGNARDRMLSQAALKGFAERSGGLFIAAPGGAALRDAFRNIVKELGTQYTIGYQPTNNAKDGKWRKIEVTVSGSDANVRTRKGYSTAKIK